MSFISESLYQRILIDPILDSNVDTIEIVSGYATSAMAFHHLTHLRELGLNVKVNLTIGMIPNDGISFSNHKGFQSLVTQEFSNQFSCNYVINQPQVHTKLYVGKSHGEPVFAFTGSANYTQTALRLETQRELVVSCDPIAAMIYLERINAGTFSCISDSISRMNFIANNRRNSSSSNSRFIEGDASLLALDTYQKVSIPLVSSKTGEIQKVGGLNWGQRPGRERNQAYIQLTPDVYHSDFFPIRGIRFTVLTDDGTTFICTRAQKDNQGQAIETPQNNSLLGKYFRTRLGLEDGAFVSKSDLLSYGVTEVVFYKIDEENYYMDFSVN